MRMTDEELADIAMDNSFDVITGRIEVKNLFDNKDEVFWLAYLPGDKTSERNVIEILIDHYIYHEEYEKCSELVKLKEEKYNEVRSIKD